MTDRTEHLRRAKSPRPRHQLARKSVSRPLATTTEMTSAVFSAAATMRARYCQFPCGSSFHSERQLLLADAVIDDFAVVAADIRQRLLGGADRVDQIVDLRVEQIGRDLRRAGGRRIKSAASAERSLAWSVSVADSCSLSH